MISMQNKIKKNWLMGCMICITFFLFLPAMEGNYKRSKDNEHAGQINGLLSQDSRIRDQAVDSILQDRRAIINKLIPLIDPDNTNKYSDQTRCAAAYLLGVLRATEAVPVLSRALENEPGRKLISDISRYDAPAWTALVRIGRPVVPAMIENIETSDNKILRKKSIDVLYHVLGGKRRVLELLNKLKARAEDRLIIEHVDAAIKYTKEHFKEDKEPLY
jgi:HEAT repeat protein